MFSVDFLGSHPDLNNDDCWAGVDGFQTLDEALAFNKQTPFVKHSNCEDCTEFFVISSEHLKEPVVIKNPEFDPKYMADYDAEWHREQSRQFFMMGGKG